MARTVESAFNTTLAQSLKASGSETEIKLAALPLTITSGVMKIGSGNNVEWVYFGTVDAGSVEIRTCVRGLKKNASTTADALAANKKNFSVGDPVRLVYHSVDINQTAFKDGTNTFTGTNTFSGAFSATLSLKVPVYADATARDAAIPAPANGMIVYNTAVGLMQKRLAGAWVDDTAGGAVANADTTTAGKVELETQAESDSGASTGGTGASVFARPLETARTIQKQSWVYAASSAGTDTYAITLTPAPTAYATGQEFSFNADVANAGAATLNVNALGAKTIKKLHDQDLETGDIEAGQIVKVVYDGTNFQMQSQLAQLPTRLFGGTSADGALSVAAGTTNLNLDQVYNYTSITIAGGATLSTAQTDGCMYLKCTGNFTNAGTINLSGKGEAGGAAVSQGSAGQTAGNPGTAIQQMPFPQYDSWVYADGSGTATYLSTRGRGGSAMNNAGSCRVQGGSGGASLVANGGSISSPTWGATATTAYDTNIAGAHPSEAGTNGVGFSGGKAPITTAAPFTPSLYWHHSGIALFGTGAGGGSGGVANNGGGTSTSGAGGRGGAGFYFECRGTFDGTGGTINLSGANGTAAATGGAGNCGAGGGAGGGSGCGFGLCGALTATGTLTVSAGSGGALAQAGSGQASNGASGAAGVINILVNTRYF